MYFTIDNGFGTRRDPINFEHLFPNEETKYKIKVENHKSPWVGAKIQERKECIPREEGEVETAPEMVVVLDTEVVQDEVEDGEDTKENKYIVNQRIQEEYFLKAR